MRFVLVILLLLSINGTCQSDYSALTYSESASQELSRLIHRKLSDFKLKKVKKPSVSKKQLYKTTLLEISELASKGFLMCGDTLTDYLRRIGEKIAMPSGGLDG